MALLVMLLLGATLGAVAVLVPFAFTVHRIQASAAGSYVELNRALRSAVVPPANAAASAANDVDQPSGDDDQLDLFSELVPSMGRTAANDPGPEGFPTSFPTPCRTCGKVRAAASAAATRFIRAARTHTH